MKSNSPQSDQPYSSTQSSIPQRGEIRFDHVSKSFRRQTAKKRSYTTLKSAILELLRLKEVEEPNLIKVMQDFSLRIPAGKAVGIIGRNGSGKSTLLKLIAGIYRADKGEITVSGSLSALIELGAGFHPDFTGRENIYLGGVMFGLNRKQIDARFDEIVAFAELEDFIDDPVRTYSSGMYMRLGFSLAVHTDPDILLIDEVLAVGDAGFIHRCQERISEFKRRGKTLVFVTHDLDSVVRWCDEALWLDRGVVKERGEPRRVVDAYLGAVENAERVELEEAVEAVPEIAPQASEESSEELTRWGSGDVEITKVIFSKPGGVQERLFHDSDPFVVDVEFTVKRAVEDLVFGIGLVRSDGVVAFGTNTAIGGITVEIPPVGETGCYRFSLSRLGLLEGSYFCDVAAHQSDGTPYDYHHLLHHFSVRSKHRHHGVYAPEHRWEFPVRGVSQERVNGGSQ